MSIRTVDNPKIVSREEWLVARKKTTGTRKAAHSRAAPAVATERRQLPWVKAEKNYVFRFPQREEKRSPISSMAKASSSFITSCSVRSGKKLAPAAPSTWIIRTAHWCILRSATFPLRQYPEHRFPKSKRSKKRLGVEV